MPEGDPTFPDNVVRFRRTRKVPPPPEFNEIKASPTTWLAIEAEEQMAISAGVIAERMGLSVQDIDKLAYSMGVEMLLSYCLERALTPHSTDGSEEVFHEAPPERKPSA